MRDCTVPDTKKTASKELVELLHSVGLCKSDTVLLHSDLSGIFARFGLVALPLVCDAFLESVGTLVVPAFNWRFCAGEPYVHETTPAETGIFSNYVLRDIRFKRSLHPIYSFAACGPKTESCFLHLGTSSFGRHSVFSRLHYQGAKIVFLGVGLESCTAAHYVEQAVGVPYRQSKLFGSTVSRDGKASIYHAEFYVRKDEWETDLIGLRPLLENAGVLQSAMTSFGSELLIVEFSRFFDVVSSQIERDPYFLARRRPKDQCKENR